MYCKGDEIHLFVNKSEIYKFEAHDNISWYEFYLGSISKNFTKDELSEILLNHSVYDFSVDHSANNEILNSMNI